MRASAPLSDTVLIHIIIRGDQRAFHELFRRYRPEMQKVIGRYTHDNIYAEDLLQEAFIKIFLALQSGRYNEEGKFLPWALRLTRNLCMDYLRKASKTPPTLELVSDALPSASAVLYEDHLTEERLLKQLNLLLALLPAEQRKVLYYRHFEEWSFREIAVMMNCSVSTTMARMRYGLSHLKKYLQNDAACTCR